jgi:uncharacterized protein (DUF362 family)
LERTTEEAMVREMEEHLLRIERDARGSVRRELEMLFLLAVEREELAVVGYGGADVQARIARLDGPPEVRAIVGRALSWASRDERSHAVLAQGLLMETGRLVLRATTLGADLGGLIAGWSAAVLQHTTPRSAPVSRLIAGAIAIVGRHAGKVPKTAEGALRAGPFRDFCGFQVGAEQTAALSWDRIAERLLRLPGGAPFSQIAAKIASDERKHERVLRVLRDAFDEHDVFRAELDAEGLGRALSDVDRAFVRAPMVAQDGPHAGRVYVRASAPAREADPQALAALFDETVVATGLLDAVLAGAPPAPKIAIKTSFMMAYDRRDPSPSVDLLLAEALARRLRERGASDVAFLEAGNHYDRFFEGRSVEAVARYLGFQSPLFRLVDVGADQVEHTYPRGVGQSSVSRTWRDADVRIVLGKMRTNPTWLVHLSLHTLESLGRRIDEMLFHDRHADLVAGLMMLIDAFPPDLSLLDATHHVPDGVVGILGDPTPCHPGRLYASLDPLALDFVAARHMGIASVPRGNALAAALDWFEDPRPHLVVDGPDSRIETLDSPQRNDLSVLLTSVAYPVYLLGERGSWWVPRMDPSAFPPKRATLTQRLLRPLLRTVFGFGRPPALPRGSGAG